VTDLDRRFLSLLLNLLKKLNDDIFINLRFDLSHLRQLNQTITNHSGDVWLNDRNAVHCPKSPQKIRTHFIKKSSCEMTYGVHEQTLTRFEPTSCFSDPLGPVA
jgi:hypothetical protein